MQWMDRPSCEAIHNYKIVHQSHSGLVNVTALRDWLTLHAMVMRAGATKYTEDLVYVIFQNANEYCGMTSLTHKKADGSNDNLRGPLWRYWKHVSDFRLKKHCNISSGNRKIRQFRRDLDLWRLTIVPFLYGM